MHYVLVSLLRQVGKEYQKHPEWTDVLFEEKKCIQDALRALNKDENIDLEKGKAEIFKVWKSCDEKNR